MNKRLKKKFQKKTDAEIKEKLFELYNRALKNDNCLVFSPVKDIVLVAYSASVTATPRPYESAYLSGTFNVSEAIKFSAYNPKGVYK